MSNWVTKLIQASALLLREHSAAQMSYLRLIKLLYIANRECLKETGMPIVSDRIVAMKHGPVLSRSLNVIKGMSAHSPEWDRHICRHDYRVSLTTDPGNGRLSRCEIRKLQEVSARFAQLGDWELVDHTHTFPEWIKNNPGESSRDIDLADILAAVGIQDQESVEDIRARIRFEDAAEQHIADCPTLRV